jgi:amino acid permease
MSKRPSAAPIESFSTAPENPHTSGISKGHQPSIDETPIASGIPNHDPEKPSTGRRRSSMWSQTPAEELKPVYDSTHRKLKPRHIQLIGIGGTIGTALFVQIGRGLINGGPGSLFLAFTIWWVTSLLRCGVKSVGWMYLG